MPRNIDQPQPCPIIAVPLDVLTAQNRSYYSFSALPFVFCLAGSKDLIALSGADNKGIIIASLDTVVDLDIPIL